MKWLDAIKLVLPIVIAAVNPALAPLAGVISQGIGTAEHMKDASGADKLAAVVTLSQLAAEGANAAAGHQVIDPAAVQSSASQAVSLSVQIANLFKHQAASLSPVPPQ